MNTRLNSPMIQLASFLLAAVLLVTATPTASARTIELQAEYMDKAALISDDAPRASWTGTSRWGRNMRGVRAFVSPGASLLIRYDLSSIPEDMRVTKAELYLPVQDRESSGVRLSMWPMLTSWDAGVCHDYRMTEPEKKTWDKPGGRGLGVDCAVQPTAVMHVEEPETQAVDVTEDVSLWHGGFVANEGWMFTMSDRGSWVNMRAPLGATGNEWMLRITYEPK